MKNHHSKRIGDDIYIRADYTGYFPILIKYRDNNEERVVGTSTEIQQGREFVVVAINVETPPNCPT